MNDVPLPYLQSLHEKLALALGTAIWAFARIEWRVHENLKALSLDHVDELVADQALRQRLGILRKLVDRRDAPVAPKERAKSAIKAIEDLSDRRNIIVHNPWQIWVSLDSSTLMTEIQKYNTPARSLDISALEQFTDAAGALEMEIDNAFNAL